MCPQPASAELRFDLVAALGLAEASAVAFVRRTRWAPGPTDDHPGLQVDAGPALILVRDEGVYLISTDAQAACDEQGWAPHVFAVGFDPARDDWRQEWSALGLPGDDFCEYLEVVESGLLKHLRHALAEGYRWLTLLLTQTEIGVAFDADDPPPFTPQVRGGDS